MTDRDADLDQALRQIGDELLQQEVPERLRHVLRGAAEAMDEAGLEDQSERPRIPPDAKSTRGK